MSDDWRKLPIAPQASTTQEPDWRGLPAGAEPAQPGGIDAKSKTGTAIRSFAKGGTFGFSDELSGLLGIGDELARRGASRLGYDGNPVEREDLSLGDALAKRYRRERNDMRNETEEGAKENPKIALASELAGAVANPIPVGKLGGVTIGGKVLTKLGQRALTGAAYGALGGLGNSDADLTQGDFGDAALDTAKGAGIGSAVGVGLGKVSDSGFRALKKLAENQALKTMGVRAGISNLLEGLGYKTADEGRELGRAALDMGLIPVLGRAENVALNADAMREPVGAMIEDSLTQANGVRPDFDKVAWKAVGNALGEHGLSARAARETAPAARLVEDIVKTGQDPAADLMALNRLKSDMYNGIDYSSRATPLKTGLQRDVVRGVKESIENHVREIAGDQAADQLATANQRWGQLADISKLAKDEALRQLGRKTPLTNLSAGAAVAHAAGGIPGMAAGAGVTGLLNLISPRLPGFVANAADNVAAPLMSKIGPRSQNLITDYLEQHYLEPSSKEKAAAMAKALRSQRASESP